ncbi:DUF6976 family protein [Reinekea marinisedimentorum]|uniref:Uncharacterized protein n=1 Tax=Reinekea marinisedimentorum TaxID=230495 RepID=A0A4R3IFK3_9GAMM|nr:hypothetical protein [Reinekea marinisedimentorum]TCS43752.1 hypothetical protein BCF53_10195 [Reinekea marinisedimentorum]
MPTNNRVSIESQMMDLNAVKALIRAGNFLMIAADESILCQLPAGNWIGGTIPYFMDESGGLVSREKIFVHTIHGCQSNNPPRITIYDNHSISRIATDAPAHGFTITIIPALSDVHLNYAQNAPEFPSMFYTPLVGWISGYHLEDENPVAKVGFGPGGSMLMDKQAVAMHVPLPENQVATVNIINLFEEGTGPALAFSSTGLTTSECTIDGVPGNFAEFITDNNIDIRSPLVADYSGIKVNVSIQNVDPEKRQVRLYAPVFEGVTYHFAKPIQDFVTTYHNHLERSGTDIENIAFSCNCMLNFMYSQLEGKKVGQIIGPTCFGEIAYQLLNQTLVYLSLTEV